MRSIPSEISPYNIQLSPDDTPGSIHVEGLTQDSAERTSELLMVNHVRYHTLFDAVGFHNHTVHHLLTLWALGASSAEIQAMYDLNKPYQALIKYHPASVAAVKMKDPAFFKECIGNLDYYEDYVRFFQDEIAEKGVPAVVNEYLFKGTELTDDILVRMHSGFLHPMIHLGCGLEFNQPCLVAEALAAGCVHDDWPGAFLLPTEAYLRTQTPPSPQPLLSVISALHADPAISTAVTPSDPLNKILGLLSKAGPQLIPHLARYHVPPSSSTEELLGNATDMIHTAAYVLGAAQNPTKVVAIDFVLLHMSTLGTFYPTFLSQAWIAPATKARLLNWKAWGDAVMYAGCGCPTLYPQRLAGYVPKHPGDGWAELCHRANVYPDDGHVCKVVRAVMGMETLGEVREGFPVGRDALRKVAHVTLDSVERMMLPGGVKIPERLRKTVGEEMGQDEEILRVMVRWVRWGGVEGAWEYFPDLVEEGEGEMKV